MDWITVAVLAVVQGFTEFLPISSSGHLVIGGALLAQLNNARIHGQIELNIVLHGGTLASILVFYRRRIWRLVGEDRRVIGLIVVGTLPAVLIGLPLKELAPEVLANPLLTGLMLLATAAILLAGGRLRRGEDDYARISYLQALLIGLAQAVAILPGISRSGATIVCGMSLGLRREAAATFSFLLAIPAITGGLVLEALDSDGASSEATGTPWPLLLLGAVIAFAVGLVALWWLVRWLERGRLHLFAVWCVLLGLATLIWQIAGR